MSIEMNIAPLIPGANNVPQRTEADTSSARRAASLDASLSTRRVETEQSLTPGNEVAGQELEDIVVEMNSVAQNLQRDLLFSVDEKSGGTFVKVIDKDTDEVVREIPSREIRDIKARLEEVSGLIFSGSV